MVLAAIGLNVIINCLNEKGDEKQFEVFLDSYVKELVDFLKVHFSDICDSENAAKMLSGLSSESEVELHATATIESLKILLIESDDNCEKIGETSQKLKISALSNITPRPYRRGKTVVASSSHPEPLRRHLAKSCIHISEI
jgi:hypothetical protein